jgi:hypothetical protein
MSAWIKKAVRPPGRPAVQAQPKPDSKPTGEPPKPAANPRMSTVFRRLAVR